MRHDWIFDVLIDLQRYAHANGLSALALKAEDALRIARAEVAAALLAEAVTEAEDKLAVPARSLPH